MVSLEKYAWFRERNNIWYMAECIKQPIEKDEWAGFKKRPLIDFSDHSLYALHVKTGKKEFIARFALDDKFAENIAKKVKELEESWR